MSSLHPTLHRRPRPGTADLPALLALWPACPACRLAD